jgi:multiple sugar transport system substrate-binding protein
VDKKALPSSPALAQILKIIAKPTLHVGVLLSSQETDALSRGWQQVALGEITVAEWTASMQAALEASPSKQ